MEEFNKASLTAEEQLNLLISRNLRVNDFDSAVAILKRVGYYHLSSYMRLFQTGDNHIFNDGWGLFKGDDENLFCGQLVTITSSGAKYIF